MNDFRKVRSDRGYGSEDMADRAEREMLIRRYNEEEARNRMRDLLYGGGSHLGDNEQP